MKKILLAMFILLFASTVWGTTYYVAKTGNDTTGDGSSSLPWLTIKKAAATATAGDTVLVGDGTYQEAYSTGYAVYLTRAGSSGNYITFKSENKWGAVIDGQNTRECVTLTQNASYVRIENFEIKNCNPVGIASNDPPSADYVQIVGNKIHHASHDGITIAKGSDNWLVDGNLIYDVFGPDSLTNQYHGIYPCYSNSWTLNNNIIYDIPKGWPVHISCSSLGSQTGGKIVNNTFADDTNSAQMGHIIVGAVTPSLIIENNISFEPPNGAMIRMYTDNTGQTITVRNNLTDAAAICGGTYASQCTLSGNLTSTNPGFTDSANRDYTLLSASSAFNGGVATNAPTTDILGVTRPTGAAVDIGAYELGCTGTDTTSPTAPTNVAVATEGEGTTTLKVSWTAGTDACGIVRTDIWRCTGATCTTMSLAGTVTTATSFTDSGLTPNTTYRYRLIAYDAANNASAFTSYYSGTTDAEPAEDPPDYYIAKPGDTLDLTTAGCSDFTDAGAYALTFTVGGVAKAYLYYLADHLSLYYCFTALDTDIWATYPTDNGQQLDDSIEMIFDVDDAGTTYPDYRFVVSADNKLRDDGYDSTTFSISWDTFYVRKKVFLSGSINTLDTDTGWTVKGFIPWATWSNLTTFPLTGTRWRFAARWNDRRYGAALASYDLWNTDGGSQLNPAGMGVAEFVEIPTYINLIRP